MHAARRYKKAKLYDQMIRLVQQYRKDNLTAVSAIWQLIINSQ